MADFSEAIDYLLTNEGGLYPPDGNPDLVTGELANFGITLRWLQTIHPDATPDTIRNLTRQGACDLYEQYWWDFYKVNSIPSDPVATKLLDAMVNCGAGTAVKIFQQTLNEPIDDSGKTVAVDGLIGPQVIAAVQVEMSQSTGVGPLLDAFAINLVTHYEKIAADNPKLASNLPGWESRAEKLPTLS